MSTQINIVRGIYVAQVTTVHIARNDFLPTLWPLCRNGMDLTEFHETAYPVNCTHCQARQAQINHEKGN